MNAGDSRKKIPPARVLAELKRRSRALTDMADTLADKFMDKGMRRIQRLHDLGNVGNFGESSQSHVNSSLSHSQRLSGSQ